MIKGIYNENEFYTNFYWDNKFLEDLKSKIGDGINSQAAITTIKGLDKSYWELCESPADSIKQNLSRFYSALFRALGYSVEVQNRQASDGSNFTLFVDAKKGQESELLAVVTEQDETGSFETVPAFFGDVPESDFKLYARNLSELLDEEFQESQNPSRWILVGSPRALFLLERGKWSFGRFIKIDWQEIFLQRDQKPYEIVYGLFSKSVLCPDLGNSIHDEFDDNSHRHAFEVTTELRENVREAIELLINEMIDLKKEGHQKIYSAETADVYAKELTHDALYYVYRLLFLLYLEAQGDDSDLLPLKSEIYRYGYSLEKLLELDFVQIQPDSVEAKGTFIYESLDKIFNLIFNGFEPGARQGLLKLDVSATGFLVKGIKSDLFDPNVIKHLKGVKLRNETLHKILKKLSLTRPRRNEKVSRVSYSNLGINQLGAVYEGLLSYSGFFAEEELHALKPTTLKQSDIDNGKELDQVYLAPKPLVEKYRRNKDKKHKLTDENLVLDESGNPKVFKKGSFIYRLAGRDRQKLASFYTPESLTKCTVKYSLKVLFENKKTLQDLSAIKILEPAMGSGAFLNEAVNQIADRILELEVTNNVGELKTPKDKRKRLWEIKYQLISQNVYGVDLNPMAIELARFSLWLNCIGAEKEPPQFTGRLKVGNSLIGARFKKGADGIYPWLLPDDGMMNYGKRLKDYDPDQYDKLQAFRKDLIYSKLESSHGKIIALQLKAESVLKELIESKDANKKRSAYERLKLCGDLWCSAFFLVGDDLKSYPEKHETLCDVYASILENDSIDPKLQTIVEEKYRKERFFHWDIEFPEIIAAGGFDLILGNPPWLAVEWRDSLYVSDINPVPAVLDLNAAQTKLFVDELTDRKIFEFLSNEFIKLSGYSNLLENSFYKKLRGIPKNTYKAFDVLAFYLMAQKAVFGVIQEDGVLEDKKASDFRKEMYLKYKYHFQFQNEKFLFSEVGHAKRLSVNIFENVDQKIEFEHIGNLFLPSTIDSCFEDVATDDIPLIKNINGEWETRGHPKRIVKIDSTTLELFSKFLSEDESTSPVFLNVHSQPLMEVIKKIGLSEKTIESYLGRDNISVFDGIDETVAQREKIIVEEPIVSTILSEVIYSAPQITAFNPLAKQSLEVYSSKFSFEEIALAEVPLNFLPRCRYRIIKSELLPEKTFSDSNTKKYSSFFKIFTRSMINPTNERCSFAAIIPRQVLHVNSIRSMAILNEEYLPTISGILGSLIIDGIQRIKNKTNFYANDFLSTPVGNSVQFLDSIGRRSLALNALTEHYSDLWKLSTKLRKEDSLISNRKLFGFGDDFSKESPIRDNLHREQAMIEVDALTALLFGLTEVELVQVYEILFPVLGMYDREKGFDRKSKLIEAHRFFRERGW